LPNRDVTTGILVANVALVAGYLVMALLGQAYGRRLMLMLSGAWTLVLGTVFFYLTIRNVRLGGGFAMTMVLFTIMLLLTIAPWGIVTTYINERFPTGIRASGY